MAARTEASIESGSLAAQDRTWHLLRASCLRAVPPQAPQDHGEHQQEL